MSSCCTSRANTGCGCGRRRCSIARAAQLIFPRLTVAGVGFDVELLYIAGKRGRGVRQTAVQYRDDDEPSAVRFAADAAAMLRDLARIRWNDWRWSLAGRTAAGPAGPPLPGGGGLDELDS